MSLMFLRYISFVLLFYEVLVLENLLVIAFGKLNLKWKRLKFIVT